MYTSEWPRSSSPSSDSSENDSTDSSVEQRSFSEACDGSESLLARSNTVSSISCSTISCATASIIASSRDNGSSCGRNSKVQKQRGIYRCDKTAMMTAVEVIRDHGKSKCGRVCDCLIRHIKGENYGPIVDLIDGCRRYVEETVGSISCKSENKSRFVRSLMLNCYHVSSSCSSARSSITRSGFKFYLSRRFYRPPQQQCMTTAASLEQVAVQMPSPDVVVCYKAFQAVYYISRKEYQGYQYDIKHGTENVLEFTDDSKADRDSVQRFARMNRLNNKMEDTDGIKVFDTEKGVLEKFVPSVHEMSALVSANGVMQKMAVGWLQNFFKLVGDQDPNDVHISLEPQRKTEIYKEYVDHLKSCQMVEYALSESRFKRVWREMFPYVSIRVYKAVTGKCFCCGILSDLRRKYQNAEIRREITDLHSFHRMTYMAERKIYYERVWKAITEPHNYMSIIMDGMSQSHTELPWLANQKEFPLKLNMHLQGILEHGRCFTIYRTFNSVRQDANAAIHCLLLHLDKRIQSCGCLPNTVFIQIDGGSENANQWMIAICELLVAMKLTKTIYLTRLPVGHTHEDIDGKFGMLWRKIRDKQVLSPQAYERILYEVYGRTAHLPFSTEDLFAVCDYQTLFEGHIDPSLARWTKEEDTQLGWRFEQVSRDGAFPLGVRTFYRAYSNDVVYEVSPSTTRLCGYIATRVYCKWHPCANPDYNQTTDGMYILQSLPEGPIVPAEFQSDFLVQFHRFINCINRVYKDNPSAYAQECIREWQQFSELYPKTEVVDEFFFSSRGPAVKVPLLDKLFWFLKPEHRVTLAIREGDREDYVHQQMNAATQVERNNINIPTFIATPSVAWSARSNQLPYMPSRLQLPDGARVEEANIEGMRLQYIINLPTNRLADLPLRDLRALCQTYALSMAGNKAALVARLTNYRAGRENQHDEGNAGAADAAPQVARSDEATRHRQHNSQGGGHHHAAPPLNPVELFQIQFISRVKKGQLQELCTIQGLPNNGPKKALLERLQAKVSSGNWVVTSLPSSHRNP